MAIEPIKPSHEPKQEFIVADIENEPDGKLLHVFTAYRMAGKVVHEIHATWADWFDRVLYLSSINKKFRTVYAHNGGRWDWLSLVEHLLTDGRYRHWKIEGQKVQANIVVLRVHCERSDANHSNKKNPEGKCTRFCLRFADSLYLLQSKLEVLAKKFLGEGKVDLGGKLPSEIFRENPELYFEYGRQDAEKLLLILEKSLQLIRDRICKIDSLGLTVGSTALKIWRTGFLNRTVEIPIDPQVKDFLRRGYRGGRVEVFQYGQFKNLRVYDVNSLYPYCMSATKVPISAVGDWTGVIRWKLPGVYAIRFSQKRRDILPILMCGGSGAYEGTGVYYIPELSLLREVDPDATIDLTENGYAFYEADYLFSDYVNTLYPLRSEDKDGPIDLLVKFLLNSTYGKLSQKGDREQFIVFNTIQEYNEAVLDKSRHIIELNLSLLSASETVKSRVEFEHVGIAGMITSQARAILYRGLMAAGKENVVYCDTDSVHTIGELPNELVDRTRIGYYKPEFLGSGVYAGRKLYALRPQSGSDKIRAKGVSVGGRNGFALSYDAMCTLVEGKEIKCRYFQPSTATEVMRGKASCVFRERNRTIRMTGKP